MSMMKRRGYQRTYPNKRRKLNQNHGNNQKLTKLRLVDHWYFPPKVQTGGSELKFFDLSPSSGAVPTTNNVFTTSLHLIPQGISQSERIGRKVRILAIHCEWVHSIPAATLTDESGIARFWLILDKQAGGANPSIADVFSNTSTIQTYIVPNNESRFKVLKCSTSKLEPYLFLGGSSQQSSTTWTWYLNCNMIVEFTGTSGALTTIKSNNLFTTCVHQRTAGTNARMTGRVYYLDD